MDHEQYKMSNKREMIQESKLIIGDLHGKPLRKHYSAIGEEGISSIIWGDEVIYKKDGSWINPVIDFLINNNIHPSGLTEDDIYRIMIDKEKEILKLVKQITEMIKNILSEDKKQLINGRTLRF
jgi:hypothetical protein